jgi:hypothetical protein
MIFVAGPREELRGYRNSLLYAKKVKFPTVCDYLKTKHSECRLIAKGVPENGKVWDFDLMNCRVAKHRHTSQLTN